jgi:hypothetical protein
MKITLCISRWQASSLTSLSTALILTLSSGCIFSRNNASYGPNVIADQLQVVPQAALEAARGGSVLSELFSDSSSDPYRDATYVVENGNGNFELSALNLADPTSMQTLLSTIDGGLALQAPFDIASARLVVTVKDKSKLSSLSINGVTLNSGSFTYGSVGLPSQEVDSGVAEVLHSGDRFPGEHAILTLGSLNAGGQIDLNVAMDGACNLTIHIDIYGEANCWRTMTPKWGTTLVLHRNCQDAGQDAGRDASLDSGRDAGRDVPTQDVPSRDVPTQDASCDVPVRDVPTYDVPTRDVPTTDATCDVPSRDVPVVDVVDASVDACRPDSSVDAGRDVAVDTGTDVRTDSGHDCGYSSGCTRTIGYWKNHATRDAAHPERPTISQYLPIWLGTAGGSSSQRVTDAALAVSILEQAGASNGITKLRAQLLGTKLSIASGAYAGSIMTSVSAADAFLATHSEATWSTLSSTQQAQVNSWKNAFDSFNNGLSGVRHCD